MSIERTPESFAIDLDTNLADCTAIDMRRAAGGMVLLPASVTLLTYYASTSEGGTYTQVGNVGSNGDGTDDVTESTWHVLPSQLFSAHWLKIKSDVDGEATIVLKA